MNILQVVPYLKSGGVERGTVDFAKYLCREGHTSVVISGGGPLVKDLVSSGTTHYILPVHKKSLLSVVRCFTQMVAILRKEKIDVVHARSRVPAWIAYWAARKLHIPLVTTCHGVYNTHWLSHVMGWGKKVIVISHAVSAHMKEKFKVPFARISLVHRGVNLDEFKTPLGQSIRPHGLTVGIIGRITPIKGHSVLLKAMAHVLRILPEARLVIVGEASKSRYREELEMLARRTGIQDNIDFLGVRYDVPQLMRNMDLVVAPAVGEEAFGRVLIEAGASGVPVVASRIGGIVDIIEHDRDGVLVPAGDVPALAEAIADLLKDPEKRKSLARALRIKVEEIFNDQSMFKKTVEVYKEVVETPRILVLKLSALGDTILCVPSLRAIREKHPKAWISVVVERKYRDILSQCPYVNDVVVLEGSGLGRWMKLLRIARWLARQYFDIVIDLQNNRLSHALAFLSGAHQRIGHDNRKWSFLLTDRVKQVNYPLPPVQHQLRALNLLGINEIDEKLELWTHPDAETKVEAFLKENWLSPDHRLVAINPGSSEKWATKRWPLERIAWVCDELSKHNVRVVLLGAKRDQLLGRQIMKRTISKPIMAMGRTDLNELISLIKRCDVLLTSDSAPMHIASALDKPFVAFFGPTNPFRHVQSSGEHHILYKKVSCSPCYRSHCSVGHICMKEIEPVEVLESVLSLMGDRALSRS